jgi:CRISPR-associated protein Cmr1
MMGYIAPMDPMLAPLQFTIRFLCPAFLGDATQAGRWRTPPIKALLRQCWRMAYARDHGYPTDHAPMRHTEGLLFGSATDTPGKDSRRSLLRIRLASWDRGRMTEWPQLGAVPTGGKPGGDAGIYLGYGPVAQNKGGLTRGLAINAGESNQLLVGFDPRATGRQVIESESSRVRDALALAALYGTLGGRSRNGWGSFELTPVAGLESLRIPQRAWRESLALDWAHAIGLDDAGPLVWTTPACDDWRKAMKALAGIRWRVRHLFPMSMQTRLRSPEERHWLAYPTTKSSVDAWERDTSGRLPNSLRFRLRAAPDDQGKVVGIVFHMPCSPPPAFKPDRKVLEQVWRKTHQFLDNRELSGLTRILR